MGRLKTLLTAVAAAGLTALAITVAAPAAGGGGTLPEKEAGKVERHDTGPGPLELQSCLQSHGATGVPGDEREGRGLKEWIVGHQDDASVQDALQACDVYFEGEKPDRVEQAAKPDCGPVEADKRKGITAGKDKRRTITEGLRPAV